MPREEQAVYQNPTPKKGGIEYQSVTEMIDAPMFKGAGASAIGERTHVPTSECKQVDRSGDALRQFFK